VRKGHPPPARPPESPGGPGHRRGEAPPRGRPTAPRSPAWAGALRSGAAATPRGRRPVAVAAGWPRSGAPAVPASGRGRERRRGGPGTARGRQAGVRACSRTLVVSKLDRGSGRVTSPPGHHVRLCGSKDAGEEPLQAEVVASVEVLALAVSMPRE